MVAGYRLPEAGVSAPRISIEGGLVMFAVTIAVVGGPWTVDQFKIQNLRFKIAAVEKNRACRNFMSQ